MIRFLQSAWMISILGSLSYLGTTFALLRPERIAAAIEVQAQVEETRAHGPDPSWNFQNPELEQLIADLRREKEEIRQRELQLKALEARLQAERNDLATVTQTVARLQKDFDQSIIRLKDEEMANYKKLAKLHATMSPEGAANVFREMPDDEVVKIMAYMKNDVVSQILETLGAMGKTEAKRVAALTERMRRTLPPDPASGKPTP